MARAPHPESRNMLRLHCATTVHTRAHMTWLLQLLLPNIFQSLLPLRHHQVLSPLRLPYKPHILRTLSKSTELVAILPRAKTCIMQLLLLSLPNNLTHILRKQLMLMLKIPTPMPSSLIKLRHVHNNSSMSEDRAELVALAIITLGAH